MGWQNQNGDSSADGLSAGLFSRALTAHGSDPGSVADVWAEEARQLMPLPRPFDGFVEYPKRVSPTCLIHFDRNRYSVPASFANRPVSVRVYPERIVVAAEGQVIGSVANFAGRRIPGISIPVGMGRGRAMDRGGSCFKGRQFTAEVILWAVRWYLMFPVSYRDLELMLIDRGVEVDHTTIFRWIHPGLCRGA